MADIEPVVDNVLYRIWFLSALLKRFQPSDQWDNSPNNNAMSHAPRADDPSQVRQLKRQLKILTHFATILSRGTANAQRDKVVAVVSTLIDDDEEREIAIVTDRSVANMNSDRFSIDISAAPSSSLATRIVVILPRSSSVPFA